MAPKPETTPIDIPIKIQRHNPFIRLGERDLRMVEKSVIMVYCD